jgi:hypothetical protein
VQGVQHAIEWLLHCPRWGAIAVVSEALCINPKSPPRHRSSVPGPDQHKHHSIQILSDALGSPFRNKSFSLVTRPSLVSQPRGLHPRACCPPRSKPATICNTIDDIDLSPTRLKFRPLIGSGSEGNLFLCPISYHHHLSSIELAILSRLVLIWIVNEG